MSHYQKVLSFLNSFLNLEQILEPHSRIWNLKRMRELLRIFGHPEKGIFTVLIGGTKGKGSTGYFLSEILRASGLRVGFYHSPHLEGPRERIWIGGKPVSRQDFARGLFRIKRRLRNGEAPLVGARPSTGQAPSGPTARRSRRRRLPLQLDFTYFEILTLLACLLFQEKKVDVAVFEVGMGGRLDATHVLPAQLVILTTIHFDHEAYLGNTLKQIAREKAAILVPHREAVIAPQDPEVIREIRKMARRRNCPLKTPFHLRGTRIRLLGDFQKLNASLAQRGAAILRDRYDFPVSQKAMLRGVSANHWPGRMELFQGKPSILLDGAHNPHSIEALCRNLRRLFPQRRKILIFGTSRDKRTDRMLPSLAKVFKICILTASDNPRAREVIRLLQEAKPHFPILIPSASSEEALRLARRLARPQDLVVVTGSFYLIGELRLLCRN